MQRGRRQLTVEIKGRNSFWLNAVQVEWEHQFPDRRLTPGPAGTYLIEEDWLADLQRVAGQCFSRVLIAPEDTGRRQLFRRLFAPTD
ncbi:MAG: hypothetical protein JNJ50_04170 [Acidobacteria bacterium]|nr:hypothetical protein [Acidobacteriota bacterium]